ncbi:Pr6Pr family membrane protein [Sphingobacterium deserti]|uniref:Integral membrane protein n=1 Tax=Sphingobacterium deserti TaxID=1229276 RepID=A0A0B8T5X1_9SPHI|nr:Pr6Pr family membrane protein [Sphingobacterium deserti]KGE13149.1 hypothetical protein DI53_2985 [Sphingobacterium deserti]
MGIKKKLASAGMCLSWFAILAQFALMLLNREVSLMESIIRFFSYFTITTNLLVACYFTAIAFPKNTGWRNSLRSSGAATAITTCILIVGIIYQALLKDLWQPTGLSLLVDQLLHAVIPLFMLAYWIGTIKHQNLGWKSVYNWLLYPVGYLLFALGRGYTSGFYPYPFLNMKHIGLTQTAINIGLIALVTILMLTLLIVIGKTIQRLARPNVQQQ